MSPSGRRTTRVQLLRSSGAGETMTQEPTSSPAGVPSMKSWSWKTTSSPTEKGEFGSRTLFVAAAVNGLMTTSKLSSFAVGGLGCAGEAAATDTTPARPSDRTAATPIKISFRMTFPPKGLLTSLVHLNCADATEDQGAFGVGGCSSGPTVYFPRLATEADQRY